ncbi:MAG: MFS transporter [Pseudomonadota bacterium]|nr:MFS transporter [Pseudomonadota bacterium]
MGKFTEKRNVVVLATCQAIFNSARTLTFLAAALTGANMLGEDLRLATLPITMMLIGTAVGTLPAAFLMRLVGRKAGFSISSLVGTFGALICVLALEENSFWTFNIGLFLFGLYSASAQQYRFAATDIASEDFKAKAISLVLAGGVIGGFVGPETAALTKDILGSIEFSGTFMALAGFTLATGVIILGIEIPRLTKEEYSSSGRPLIEIFSQPKAIVAVTSAALGYMTMNLLMTATPLAMQIGAGHEFNSTKFVIQWHVVGMFAPGFFTGSLIERFGVTRIIMTGAIIQFSAVCLALNGNSVEYFWISLFLLGIGWNFAFTGGTKLLTEVHTAAETAKVQGTNDLIVFTGMALASLFSGTLYHFLGWQWVNFATLPMIITIVLSLIWLNIYQRTASRHTG